MWLHILIFLLFFVSLSLKTFTTISYVETKNDSDDLSYTEDLNSIERYFIFNLITNVLLAADLVFIGYIFIKMSHPTPTYKEIQRGQR
jgi:hypothetical protein